MKRNPKQEGSNLFDCKPQTGPCPLNCNQCFYNRPNAFYLPIEDRIIPPVKDVGDGVVRMNSGHDSNIQKELVIETSKEYKNVFFNTSIPSFDFPGPVVFTANPKEESFAFVPFKPVIDKDLLKPIPENEYFNLENIMFVRLRVSSSNKFIVSKATECWTAINIPVVLTFMSYYDINKLPKNVTLQDDNKTAVDVRGNIIYEWKKRHINSYFCPTKQFIKSTIKKIVNEHGRLVTTCGTVDSNYCKDCRNCEFYYWQTKRFLENK